MTAHDEFDAQVAGYALGALDRDEQRAFEAHLATCAACQAAVAEMRRVTAGVALAIEPVAPPKDLKARVIATATAPKSRRTSASAASAPRDPGASASQAVRPPMWWLAAAAVLILGVGGYAVSLRIQLATVRESERSLAAQTELQRGQVKALQRDGVRFSRMIEVLSAADVVAVDLQGQAPAGAASARAYWSRQKGLLFTADRLPNPGPGRVYQLWVVTAKAAVSAGLLTVGQSGNATLLTPMPADLAAPVAVAVTIEPAGGMPSPTGPKVLIGLTKKT